MSSPEGPEYLRALRQAWISRDRPSCRLLGEQANVSRTTVAEAITGKIRPSLATMRKIAMVLTESPEQVQIIMDAYIAYRGEALPPVTRSRSDNEIAASIREGLFEIADAIRSLKN